MKSVKGHEINFARQDISEELVHGLRGTLTCMAGDILEHLGIHVFRSLFSNLDKDLTYSYFLKLLTVEICRFIKPMPMADISWLTNLKSLLVKAMATLAEPEPRAPSLSVFVVRAQPDVGTEPGL